MDDTISRQAVIDALWKALFEYEDKTEKQFQESDDLDVDDWIQHRIFVQNMSDIDRQTILNLPSAQPDLSTYSDKLWKTAYERGKAETEPRWIPVTERLPKPYEYCLWTTTDGRVIYHHCDGLFSNYIAWMSLPKPYERSRE